MNKTIFELPYYRVARHFIWTNPNEVTTQLFEALRKELQTALIIHNIEGSLIGDILHCEDGGAYLEDLPQDVLAGVLDCISKEGYTQYS